jgi:hypothetical protein
VVSFGTRAAYYARWKDGEVDIVSVEGDHKAAWAVEVKWSDRSFDNPSSLRSLIAFCHQNDLKNVTVTTKTKSGIKHEAGIVMTFVPSSVYCYTVGRNVMTRPVKITRLPGSSPPRNAEAI